jgi:hypothetical protein
MIEMMIYMAGPASTSASMVQVGLAETKISRANFASGRSLRQLLSAAAKSITRFCATPCVFPWTNSDGGLVRGNQRSATAKRRWLTRTMTYEFANKYQIWHHLDDLVTQKGSRGSIWFDFFWVS